MDRRMAIDKRRQAEWDEVVRGVLRYKEEGEMKLEHDKKMRNTGSEIIPHPDDIDLDLINRKIVFNGPISAGQKMAQDLVVSRSKLFDELLSPAHFAKAGRQLQRQVAKTKQGLEEGFRLVARRASKVNSWEMATLRERMDFLRKYIWPTLSEKYFLRLSQSELYFKAVFRSWLEIELTEEEKRECLSKSERRLRLRAVTLTLGAAVVPGPHNCFAKPIPEGYP